MTAAHSAIPKELSLLLIGFLSLCQLCFLPGHLCLRVFRVPVRGILQTAIYGFALSLVANHTLVYAPVLGRALFGSRRICNLCARRADAVLPDARRALSLLRQPAV